MNAELARRDDGIRHVRRDIPNILGKRPAVGIAEHYPARSRQQRRLDASERVFSIVPVAVEKMLGVEYRFSTLRREVLDRIFECCPSSLRAIFLERRIRGSHATCRPGRWIPRPN